MRKVDSDRIQSFHMQALRRILGIRWYDKVSNAEVNERTKLPDSYCWQTSFIIWSHVSPTGEHTCFAGTATVNRSPHQHSSRHWLEAPAIVHEEIGCNKWKKTLSYMLVLPGSRARIVRCGGRYDPQLVKRSSEWVSESRVDIGIVHYKVKISNECHTTHLGTCILPYEQLKNNN